MADNALNIDLFALGQTHFKRFLKEFASYGLEADAGIELRQGKGLLCYYSLEDRHIYLSLPDFRQPTGKFQALYFRSILGCETNAELMQFFQIFLPHLVAHELAHHYRHRYGLFDLENLWNEEQVANKLSVAVIKHRLPPRTKEYARKLLQRALKALAAKMESKNIPIDSYYSVRHALNASGQMGVSDFENVEMIETMLGVSSAELLKGSGQLSDAFEERLEHRDELIEDINEEYTSDQLQYIYNQTGWLYLDLTSRETEYVQEFGKLYLNIDTQLLPLLPEDETVDRNSIQACFKAYQETHPKSETAGRYFYKRYRSLLLTLLQSTPLLVSAHTEPLQKEVILILESWNEDQTDTLNYLSQLAPPELQGLFPHLIAENLDQVVAPATYLPTEIDQRIWHNIMGEPDIEAINTLYRLTLLDQTDVYRDLPAELMLEIVHKFNYVAFSTKETVIWENEHNDDVYILTSGQLEIIGTRDEQPIHLGFINPGEIFGEIAFFTEDPRQATIRAVEPSECFVLTDADLQILAYK
ncbi:MAG: cyclic nucleotide-binding domain-containing protein, partial [Chloroflexota bacterium]